MKRALAIAALLAAGVAHADSIKPPAGWKLDAAQSKELGAKWKQVGVFDMPDPKMTNVDVYVPPEPGVTLFVILRAARVTAERPEAARAVIDDLHELSKRAALSGGHVVEDSWQERVDRDAKQVEAALTFRDVDAKTVSSSRRLVVAQADTLVAVSGECFASEEANPKRLAECKAALATLDTGIALDTRVEIALAPTGARPTPPADAEGPVGSGREPARMGDGSRSPLPPMTVPQEARATDRRPVYVGIGIVLLAAAFWWNRYRRARREDESDER
ncbi:MAG TPA: hypothetical protein VIV40_05665 [Kofleriaceae bacterium]